jgi:hypothetical protein
VARETNVSIAKLSEWRERALAGEAVSAATGGANRENCEARKAMQRCCAEPGRRRRLPVAWALGAARRQGGEGGNGRANRENRGARNPMQRRCGSASFAV